LRGARPGAYRHCRAAWSAQPIWVERPPNLDSRDSYPCPPRWRAWLRTRQGRTPPDDQRAAARQGDSPRQQATKAQGDDRGCRGSAVGASGSAVLGWSAVHKVLATCWGPAAGLAEHSQRAPGRARRRAVRAGPATHGPGSAEIFRAAMADFIRLSRAPPQGDRQRHTTSECVWRPTGSDSAAGQPIRAGLSPGAFATIGLQRCRGPRGGL